MGCCEGTSRPNSQEEALIVHEEFKLKFDQVLLSTSIQTLTKHAVRGVLSSLNFEAAFEELELPVSSPDAAEVAEFYRTIYNCGESPLSWVGLLAVLLCRGTSQQKIEVLFDLFSSNKADVSAEKVEMLLEEIYRVACVSLPRMVNVKSVGSSSMIVHPYLAKISSAKAAMLKRLSRDIVRSAQSVSKAQFIERMQAPHLQSLLSASSVRKLYYGGLESLNDVTKDKGQLA
jgi:hypothetical protein